jgi:hypothetical protein
LIYFRTPPVPIKRSQRGRLGLERGGEGGATPCKEAKGGSTKASACGSEGDSTEGGTKGGSTKGGTKGDWQAKGCNVRGDCARQL